MPYPRYMSVKRVTSKESIIEDNRLCDLYMSEKTDRIAFCSPAFPGEIVYPDLEISRYRPIDEALMFDEYGDADAFLRDARGKIWWYNLYQGMNEERDPHIELWASMEWRTVIIVPVFTAAFDRKRYNDFRLEMMQEASGASP